jgi:hypothetical protein
MAVTGQPYPLHANISICGKAVLGNIGCTACMSLKVPDYFTTLTADAFDLAIGLAHDIKLEIMVVKDTHRKLQCTGKRVKDLWEYVSVQDLSTLFMV